MVKNESKLIKIAKVPYTLQVSINTNYYNALDKIRSQVPQLMSNQGKKPQVFVQDSNPKSGLLKTCYFISFLLCLICPIRNQKKSLMMIH